MVECSIRHVLSPSTGVLLWLTYIQAPPTLPLQLDQPQAGFSNWSLRPIESGWILIGGACLNRWTTFWVQFLYSMQLWFMVSVSVGSVSWRGTTCRSSCICPLLTLTHSTVTQWLQWDSLMMHSSSNMHRCLTSHDHSHWRYARQLPNVTDKLFCCNGMLMNQATSMQAGILGASPKPEKIGRVAAGRGIWHKNGEEDGRIVFTMYLCYTCCFLT